MPRMGVNMTHCYVQYGCGFSAGDGWLNFDASPTLRIEKIPFFGKIASVALSGNSDRFPESVRYGDIRKGPLVPAGTADGIYASHVLEHLSLVDFRKALANTYLMLADGGVFRLIVPDLLERAHRYILDAEQNSQAAAQGETLNRRPRHAPRKHWELQSSLDVGREGNHRRIAEGRLYANS